VRNVAAVGLEKENRATAGAAEGGRRKKGGAIGVEKALRPGRGGRSVPGVAAAEKDLIVRRIFYFLGWVFCKTKGRKDQHHSLYHYSQQGHSEALAENQGD